jgi:copper resistance protein B
MSAGRLACMVAALIAIGAPCRAQSTSRDSHAAHQAPPPAATQPAAPSSAPQGTPPPTVDPHAGHAMAADAGPSPPPPSLAPVTDEMRKAAFPVVVGHPAHDRAINTFVLVDELEWRTGAGADGPAWSAAGWAGGDRNRLWFRTEGNGEGGSLDDAEAHVLYGRAIARWWDVVAGVRQDFDPGAQAWLAVGLQGVAPGFFDVKATAYLADAGQAALRLEVEYDLLITNRLVLQPVGEANLYGRSNPSLGVGSGLSSGELGLRLRYQLRRELAPYVGVTWIRTFGETTDLAHQQGVNGRPRLVTGVRVWF